MAYTEGKEAIYEYPISVHRSIRMTYTKITIYVHSRQQEVHSKK